MQLWAQRLILATAGAASQQRAEGFACTNNTKNSKRGHLVMTPALCSKCVNRRAHFFFNMRAIRALIGF